MIFDKLQQSWNWQPIRHCPGRYVLLEAKANLSLRELLGTEVEAREYKVAAARDTVVVIPLDRGGLISYKRDNGSYLHTLNTPEGFQRKLLQLGIKLY